ncbi:hypothetical protein BL144_00015570 [Klebsiella pneumoniae]|nr:hypothetical protein BL144_00015570 [Klebsiella pneumoniae]
MVHVWEYLTRCGHKFLWLKINPLPPGYTGSVYRAQFEIYSGFVNGMVASHLLCHSGTINRHSLNGALLS